LKRCSMRAWLRSLTMLLVSAAMLVAQTASAGSRQPDHHVGVRAYSMHDGLLAGRVQAIAQDKRGYLWLGTSSVLMRFDAFQFVPWGVHDEPRLIDRDIKSLLVARDGSVWVGFCNGGGVSRISGREITNFTLRDNVQCVQALAQDRDGTI